MTGSAMEASQTTVEQLTRKYCSMGRFDLAFEVEHHDELANLTLDWLVRGKMTTLEAREIYSELRTKWSARRHIEPSVWLGL